MPEESKFFSTKRIIFTFLILIVLVLSLWYVYSVYPTGGIRYFDKNSDLGDALGILGLTAIILVYSRSIFKLLVQKGTFSKRLEPLEPKGIHIETFMKKILRILNVLHPYFGAIAVVAIFLHCYFTSSFADNLLLLGALFILAWNGIFGFFLKLKYTPSFLRKHSYLVHAQLFTGILILILAGLGHMILGN
jgi:hypothetical protein